MAVTDEERTALALDALAEITDPAEVGGLIAFERPEPGVVDLRFACTLSAYAGWSWIVSTSDVDGVPVTVLEVELLPGEGALLAPPWVPWAERLAEWRRQHPDERHPGEPAGDEGDLDDESELDDEEEVDEEDLGPDDDLDGVDEVEAVVDDEHDQDDEDDQGAEHADAAHVDPSDDESDADDEDVRGPRPGEVDRSL